MIQQIGKPLPYTITVLLRTVKRGIKKIGKFAQNLESTTEVTTYLSESSTREWWRHMKSLMGYTSNNGVEMQGLANNLCEGNIEALANR